VPRINKTSKLTLALPKGRVLDETVTLFGAVGIDLAAVRENSRKLIFEVEGFRVLVVRDADVPTYVAHGAADAGVVGSDVLEEQGLDLYEPLDLGIGRCRMSIAGPAEAPPLGESSRPSPSPDGARKGESPVRYATKFPKIARRFLEARSEAFELIKLQGAIELGPLVGLCDRIIDIVSTGETLKQNRLVEIETLMQVSARLVVNRASLKLHRRPFETLLDCLSRAVVGAKR
jgi:ATP phosphoribosyltransferase